MNSKLDYYQILGVSSDAEEIVIKAAFRALASKYHPDKYDGDKKIATSKMQEINEAYSILSDPKSRKKYDQSIQDSEYEYSEQKETDDILYQIESDWNEVTEYYPDLVRIASSLAIISRQIEFRFKVILLEKKDFKNRLKLAKEIKTEYLTKYFGNHIEIHDFAEELFKSKRTDVLKKLNRAINLLGPDADPELIIEKIENESDFNNHLDDNLSQHYATQLLELLSSKNNKKTIVNDPFWNPSDVKPTDNSLKIAMKFLESINIKIVHAGLFRSIVHNTPYILCSVRLGKIAVSEEELIKYALIKIREFGWSN